MACLFCHIVDGSIPAKKVFEDDHVLAFEDIRPLAPLPHIRPPPTALAGLPSIFTATPSTRCTRIEQFP